MRPALLLAALLLAGCAAPVAPDEPTRPRATLPPPPGLLDEAWLDSAMPERPLPFDDLVNATYALKASDRATVLVEGFSLQERPVLSVFLARGEPGGKPTIMFTGSQHGNEPSGTDAAILLATLYAFGGDDQAALLDEVNLFFVLCANPDGRVADTRGNADEVDVNRDHMNLATPEGRILHAAYHRVDPAVIVDLHQFGAPPLDVPPTPVSSDIVFEVASVQNPLAYPGILAASLELEGRVLSAVAEVYGPGAASSYPPTESSQDSSIHRNHYGMHNSLSLLFEARRPLPDYAKEVRLHVIGAQEVIRQVAADPARSLAAKAEAESETARPPGVRGYLAPPQDGLANLTSLLQAHGFNVSVSEQALGATGLHYGASAEVARVGFPNGTLVARLDQPDWRALVEQFESTQAKDGSYKEGPRDRGLDVWREVQLILS